MVLRGGGADYVEEALWSRKRPISLPPKQEMLLFLRKDASFICCKVGVPASSAVCLGTAEFKAIEELSSPQVLLITKGASGAY